METPLNGGFVEKQHKIKSPAWNDKTTECLASHSDCHKTAKIMSYEDAILTTYHSLLYVNSEPGFKFFIGNDLDLQLQC